MSGGLAARDARQCPVSTMHACTDLQQCNACEALFTLNREVDNAWQTQGCVILLQTGESWNRTVRPKAIGAWNTDAASRGLPALEHFIFFSSVVAAQGNAGAPTQRNTHRSAALCGLIWVALLLRRGCLKEDGAHACLQLVAPCCGCMVQCCKLDTGLTWSEPRVQLNACRKLQRCISS